MGRDDKRTSISLAQVVWQMAEEMMKAKGFNDNFSSYVADLIRRDREREGKARAVIVAPAVTSQTNPNKLNEPAGPVTYPKLKRK